MAMSDGVTDDIRHKQEEAARNAKRKVRNGNTLEILISFDQYSILCFTLFLSVLILFIIIAAVTVFTPVTVVTSD